MQVAQLRRDFAGVESMQIDLVVIGPDKPVTFNRQAPFPFPTIADPKHALAKLYGQEVSLLKFGRMPAVFAVGADGRIRLAHYGKDMRDWPKTDRLMEALKS